LELGERSRISGLVLLKELKDFLDSLGAQLLVNGVEIGALVLPEIDLRERIRVLSVLEGRLWVSL
jgi:hypothetical protein